MARVEDEQVAGFSLGRGGDAGKESNYEMASPLSETRSLPVKRTCGRCMCNTRATTRVAVMRVYKS